MEGRTAPVGEADLSRMGKQKVIIYWLIPVAEYRELFGQLIVIRAAKFDAQRFD